jgi:hypothetical protein
VALIKGGIRRDRIWRITSSPDGETVLMELDPVSVGASPVIPISIIARIIEPDPRLRDVRLYFDPRPLGLTADSSAATVSP